MFTVVLVYFENV